jgi:hypothetical protein
MKMVSEFAFILTVVLRVTPVVFTVGEMKHLPELVLLYMRKHFF